MKKKKKNTKQKQKSRRFIYYIDDYLDIFFKNI